MTDDAVPTIGNPELLAEHRKRSNAVLLRSKLAEGLRKLAGYIAKNQVKAGSPHGAFVVLLTDGEPVLTWYGEVDWDDLRTASYAMHDANMARYRSRWDGDRPISERVSEGWQQRRAHEARRRQKQAAQADEKPWMCEYCDRRFRTERGANQHERSCWKNPAARQHQSSVGYTISINPEGRRNALRDLPDDD